MDTELGRILKTIWRWSWLIILCVLLAGGATWYSLYNTEPMYEASTTLQFSTPDRGDVELVEQYTFVSARDEITLAISNFMQIAESLDVREATVSQLNLSGANVEYELSIESSRDADFVEIKVGALAPNLAADIVNTHSEIAKMQFGELRARPANDSKIYFQEQIQEVERQLSAAHERLNNFRDEHSITFLDTEKQLNQDMLIQLQNEQTKLVAGDAIGQARRVVQLDARMDEQRNELARLANLEPEYNQLDSEIAQVQETQDMLMNRYTEANLKEVLARKVNFIQIVAPASPPTEPTSGALQTLILSIVGSLGLGLVLAFLLDYLLGYNQAPAQRTEQVVIGSDVVVNRIRSTNDLKHIRSSREFERMQPTSIEG